jgi:hypothetical protein
VLGLTDSGRRAVAAGRAKVDERFHERALRSVAGILPAHAEEYAQARMRVAAAHVPEQDRLDAEWSEISRLVQLAIDEGLVAMVCRVRLHPNYLRELLRPWIA